MILQFLRHATAEPDSPSGDSGRALNSKGREQAGRVGRFCLAHDIVPDIVLHSPLLRAKQTAQVFASVCSLSAPPIEEAFLACGMDPGTAYAGVASYAKFSTVMIVGHEPDFSTVSSDLIGGGYGAIHVKKASLLAVAATNLRSGAGTLLYSIPCSFMK